jgi:spermidine/putrescine transport system substrate-binding protein
MAMKLKDEGKLIPFSPSFYQYDANDPNLKHNYYAKNVSAYTNKIFKDAGLDGYIAGYMWGSTGFVYNPDKIGATPENAREIMSSWYCLTNEACERKITAKDNTRDSYFMGLGMYYEDQLLNLLQNNPTEYANVVDEWMNNTDAKIVSEVKKLLVEARQNLYGLETDEGKMDVAMGRLDASYQWSGDAVFILDEAEKHGLELEYSIPKSASNLWFDGWVMMEGANTEAAMAFVNFLSRYDNAIRNMYYIGYTSCLAGEEIFDYVEYTYSDEEGDTTYDLSYFFGEGHFFTTSIENTRRQLFAQYPTYETTQRLVVMEYFQKEENERVNRMWNNIK